ncbi:MAG: phosphoribosylamine--glycine ligase [Alphaproteobacteria bacterium]|jgi:phosphoribosylamine--glycine ligase|nr:phosphoribosylamine--glycine ligase [Alphaproteobacteria bacterium]MDP6565665.1 phosphoribosylamine--glycine ligase [Alphaproteobacteria bacterium]MDP6813682.1 phosphoribosylamine--glycine ligase [Alphaproteobacteria bacterium]
MHVLVIGSGGREHALCWALARSPKVARLSCAPGNGGIGRHADCVPIGVDDFDGIVAFCRREEVGLAVVGPEVPLVDGLADQLSEAGITVFGPSAKAAILEGSKAFMKDLCARHGIPTAAYRRFTEAGEAGAYIRAQGAPIVIKADGLAAGKGAVVCQTVDEAVATAEDILGGRFGEAGAEIVVEEFMVGEEASFFALCDGATALPLATAQDHKQVGDGDTGPNTGGMGAYSPAPVMTDEICRQTMERIILPTMRAMAEEGRPYAGVLYAGLMITEDGPRLIEYNVRFGDPECQVLMARWQSDLAEALLATAEGRLAEHTAAWTERCALTVVMATNGYPGDYAKGSEIGGLEAAEAVDGVTVLHAGTRAEDGRILANGGRVLGVTALGDSIAEAQARAYQAVDAIDWPEGFCRRDIGWRAVAREGAES